MIGSIIGDILAYPYQLWLLKADGKDMNLYMPMCRFTDDSVLTIATADAILNNVPYHESYKKWALKYPESGFGPSFYEWFNSPTLYVNNSYSNGCAMRISPVGYAYNSLEEIKKAVAQSIKYTHESDEAFRGAYAIAAAVYMARTGKTKTEIKSFIEKECNYNLNYTIEDIKKWDKSTCRCDVTIPQALIVFLNSNDYEDTIRNSIYSEGDCDTIACMSGGIAEAYYKELPLKMKQFCEPRLPDEFKSILAQFYKKYMINS